MSLPGFSAEASLYQSEGTYTVAAGFSSGGGTEIAPQFWSDVWKGLKKLGGVLWGAGCEAGCGVIATAAGAACLRNRPDSPYLCVSAGLAMNSICTKGCNA